MPKPRKHPALRPLKTMRIFCEGEKTEPSYIKAYLSTAQKDGRRSVVEVERTAKNTAVQLVEEAIKALKSKQSLPDDEVWVVYDRESVAKYSDELHAKAWDRANRAGVKVALTNVCFEYWVLLHFVDTTAPYGSFDELSNASKLRIEFKKASGKEYDKADANVFDVTKSNLKLARARAKMINKQGVASADAQRQRPYHVNPFVGFVELLDAIDAFQ